MVEEGRLDEELRERPRLDVVIIGFRDPTDPRIRRAVRRNVEVESLFEIGSGRKAFRQMRVGCSKAGRSDDAPAGRCARP
jgi:hypothetical protein